MTELMFEEFKDLKGILDSLDIPFFLLGGVLLGLYRDGKILEQDDDIDVGIMEEYLPKYEYIINNLRYMGYAVIDYIPKDLKDGKGRTIFFYKKSRPHISSIFTFYRLEHYYWYNTPTSTTTVDKVKMYTNINAYPEELFNRYEVIKWGDSWFYSPAPVDQFLKAHYGEGWITPTRKYYKTSTINNLYPLLAKEPNKVRELWQHP